MLKKALFLLNVTALSGFIIGVMLIPENKQGSIEKTFVPKIYPIYIQAPSIDVETRTVTASAYTSREVETDYSPCISASGDDICELHRKGVRVAASNDLPFHKIIWAAGEKWEILDRMNKRYTGKNRIDLYMGDDLQGAKDFGVRKIEVMIQK